MFSRPYLNYYIAKNAHIKETKWQIKTSLNISFNRSNYAALEPLVFKYLSKFVYNFFISNIVITIIHYTKKFSIIIP